MSHGHTQHLLHKPTTTDTGGETIRAQDELSDFYIGPTAHVGRIRGEKAVKPVPALASRSQCNSVT